MCVKKKKVNRNKKAKCALKKNETNREDRKKNGFTRKYARGNNRRATPPRRCPQKPHLLQGWLEAPQVVLAPAPLVDALHHVRHGAPRVAHLALGRRNALQTDRQTARDRMNERTSE